MKTMVSFDLRKTFEALALVFVAVGTIFYIPLPSGTDLGVALGWGYTTQELYFRHGALFLIVFSVFLPALRKTSLFFPASFFIYFFILSLLMGFDIKMRSSLTNIGIAVIFLKVVAENCGDMMKKTGIFFLGVLALNLLMCALQFYGKEPLLTPVPNLGATDSIVGFMRIKVHLGVLAAIMAPFLFFLNPFLALICLPLLYASQSSVAVVCFLTSMLFLSFFRFGKKTFTVLSSFLFIGALAFIFKYDMPGGNFGDRFELWFKAISFSLKTNPVLGCGIGAFYKVGFHTMQENGKPLIWDWAHNEYLQTFFEGGVTAFSIVCLYAFNILKKINLAFQDYEFRVLFASTLTILMASFFHFPFHIARLAIPCIFILSLFHLKAFSYEN